MIHTHSVSPNIPCSHRVKVRFAGLIHQQDSLLSILLDSMQFVQCICMCVCVFKVCQACLESFRALPWLWVVPLAFLERYDFVPQAIWCVFSGLIREKQRGIGVQQMIDIDTHTQTYTHSYTLRTRAADGRGPQYAAPCWSQARWAVPTGLTGGSIDI